MRCPDGLRDGSSFVRFLEQIGRQLIQKATLFLMNDPHVIVGARYRDVLDKYYEIPLPNWRVVEQCLDKAQMYGIARQAGIPIPVTFVPSSEQELEAIANGADGHGSHRYGSHRRLPYPCILKPISRHEYRDGTLRQKAFQHTYGVKALRANNADELLALFHRVRTDDFRVIVQEEIPGADDTLYTVGLYADRQSELRGTFTGRKLHQFPPDFGLCTFGESLHEPLLLDMGARLAKALGFHGIAQIEFKLDVRDGLYKLMEINPRGWQWSYLATACGVNLPYLAHCDLHDLPLPDDCITPSQAMTRQTWTHLADEFQRFWQFARVGRLSNGLQPSSREPSKRKSRSPDQEAQSAWDWLSWAWTTMLSKDNHDAVLSWRDPVPGLMMVLRGTLVKLRRVLRQLYCSVSGAERASSATAL
jgi:predicted ATP-grasp superfamily ATP-dependent carboligase